MEPWNWLDSDHGGRHRGDTGRFDDWGHSTEAIYSGFDKDRREVTQKETWERETWI